MWIGCAMMPYGARKKNQPTWYATTPPSTDPPATIAAPNRTAATPCWTLAQPESRNNADRPSWVRLNRGCSRNPERHTAIVGAATKARTPSVPPRPSSACSAPLRSSPGPGPADHRNSPRKATITTVLPMGASAGTTKRRWAWSTAVAIAPTP